MRFAYSLPFLLLSGQQLCAQSSPSSHRAIESITEADVRRRVFIIADDSMMGRNTPSRGLDLTAQYIADEFKRLGLKPGGDGGSYLQRYPISRRKLDVVASAVVMQAGATTDTASFRSSALYLTGERRAQPAAAAVVVTGQLTPQSVASMSVAGKSVIWVTEFSRRDRAQVELALAIQAKRPNALIVLSKRDSVSFARQASLQGMERFGVEWDNPAGAPIIEVAERSVSGVLAAAGLDIAKLRGDSAPNVRDVAKLVVRTTVKEDVSERTTAPNTVGILEGSDPVLKKEYLVYSAHMDHVGVSRNAAAGDSINNGADDDASGTVGVVELAEAFSQPGARPKRSIIFLTVSGEEKGLWGSEWFAEHPPVPLDQIVANLNMDMIGRNWKDTIVVIGKEHSDLGETMNRVNAAHPELGLSAIDDLWPQESFYTRSDHFNFARRGVPVLFFFNGVHKDYHRPTDSPDKIDAEKEARILRLVYLVGEAVANAPTRPQWKEESRKKIVQ